MECKKTKTVRSRPALWLAAAVVFLTLAGLGACAEPSSSALALKHLRTLKNDFAVTVLAWHPDGRHLAVGQVLNNKVVIWDTRVGKVVRVLDQEGGGVHTLAYSPDGKYLAVGRGFIRHTKDHAHVHLYDAATFALRYRFVPPSEPPKGDSNSAYALAFSPDSRYLAAVGYGSAANLVVYDVITGGVLGRLPDEAKLRSQGIRVGSIEAVQFSPDGRLLSIGRNLGELEIWSIRPWKLLKKIEAQSGGVRALAFSPDGKYLASATQVGKRYDRSSQPSSPMFGQFPDDIVLWSVPAFEKAIEYRSERHRLPGQTIIDTLQFSPDGRWLLVGARAKSIEIIDIVQGKTALYKDGLSAIAELALRPDGRQLAVGVGKRIQLYTLIVR